MIVFTYPGQGSQKEGMGREWVDHPSWELVEDASSISGRDLAALLLETNDQELKETKNAQLATFLTSMVIFDALHVWELMLQLMPDIVWENTAP